MHALTGQGVTPLSHRNRSGTHLADASSTAASCSPLTNSNMKRATYTLVTGVVAAAVLATSATAQVIDTRPGGSLGTINLGFNQTQSRFMQTFTAPVGAAKLSSFTFWLGSNRFPASQTFKASIFHSSIGVGVASFVSALTNIPGGTSASPFAFTPNISVVVGDQYSAVLDFGSSPAFAQSFVNFQNLDTYAGGSGYVNGTGPGGWNDFGRDMSFRAEFKAAADPGVVPEPATLGLVGLGMVGLAGFARRRRR